MKKITLAEFAGILSDRSQRWYLVPLVSQYPGFPTTPDDQIFTVAVQCLVCSASLEGDLLVLTHTGMGDMAEPVEIQPIEIVSDEQGTIRVSQQVGVLTLSGGNPDPVPGTETITRRFVNRDTLLATLWASNDSHAHQQGIAAWLEGKEIGYVRKYPQLTDTEMTIDFKGQSILAIRAELVWDQGKPTVRLALKAITGQEPRIGDKHYLTYPKDSDL